MRSRTLRARSSGCLSALHSGQTCESCMPARSLMSSRRMLSGHCPPSSRPQRAPPPQRVREGANPAFLRPCGSSS
eukprot:8874984-Alexandrium_andersonii.AAC.1